MDNHRYINEMLLAFFETIPSDDLDGIVSQFVFARKRQYPRATKLINTKHLKNLAVKKKWNDLLI